MSAREPERQPIHRRGGAWLGAWAALLPSWLAVAGLLALTWRWALADNSGRAASWLWAFVIAVWVTTFPILSFGAGLICAFFWHPLPDHDRFKGWGTWVVIGVFAPTFLGCGAGCAATMLGFLPCLWLFNLGLERGLKWWPERAWRQFFGLSNSWERDDEGEA